VAQILLAKKVAQEYKALENVKEEAAGRDFASFIFFIMMRSLRLK